MNIRCLIALLLCLTFQVKANDYFWTSLVGGNVSYFNNWNGGIVPSQNDNASFGPGGVINIDAEFKVKNVTFFNGSSATINANQALKINGVLTISTPTTVTLNSTITADIKSINLNSGTFLIGGSAQDKIGDSAGFNMLGGSVGFVGNVDEKVGALTLTSTSTIDFGGGKNSLMFDSYNIYNTNQILRIVNWNTNDTLTFSTAPTSNQLQTIRFVDPYGDGNDFYGEWDGREVIPYKVKPIPEPSTVWMGLLLVISLFFIPL